MTKLTYGSLFSGIGGFDLGFDQAGLTCAWQVEKDSAAQSVLKTHWSNTPKYKDVKNVGRNLEPVDLICGGFPCQDVSIAGRREGLAGNRSGLWFEFRRIIEEIRPQWVVIENVPGLLSSNKGRDMGAVIGGLAELGYWWAYRCLDAQYWGVPQRRRRVFIVGCLAKGCAQEILFESESGPWDTPPRRKTRAEAAGAITPDAHPGSYNGQDAYTGNLIAFAPQAGGKTGLNINENLSGTLQENQVMAVAYSVRPRSGMPQGWNTNLVAFGGNNTQGEVSVASRCNAHGSGRYDFESETFITGPLANASGQRGWHVSAEDAASGKILPTGEGVRRLTPLECERLQGFPDGWTAGQSDSARYRQLGNAVAVPVARWLGRRILDLIG
jgi:DNA (cytosine-5)-methyltransferase 1